MKQKRSKNKTFNTFKQIEQMGSNALRYLQKLLSCNARERKYYFMKFSMIGKQYLHISLGQNFGKISNFILISNQMIKYKVTKNVPNLNREMIKTGQSIYTVPLTHHQLFFLDSYGLPQVSKLKNRIILF